MWLEQQALGQLAADVSCQPSSFPLLSWLVKMIFVVEEVVTLVVVVVEEEEEEVEVLVVVAEEGSRECLLVLPTF